MATLLIPDRTSPHNNNSYKYKLDCNAKINPEDPDTKSWLELQSIINHSAPEYKIFIGLLEKQKKIVVKIGSKSLEKEYNISIELEKLSIPTFLSFNCMFNCLDDLKSINYNTKSLCKTKGQPINIIVMPFIPEGQIDKYEWMRKDFELLKNILKHITISILYSAFTIGFIHRDTHLGNIMLKKTKRHTITYNEFGNLDVMGLMPIIMDYDRSVIGMTDRIEFIYEDLRRIYSLISTEINIKLDVNNLLSLTNKLTKSKTQISLEVCNSLCIEIDKITIRYITSELPPMPQWGFS